jgi:interleukin-1 receptor-associated kinase 1
VTDICSHAFVAFVETVGFNAKPCPEFFGTSIRAIEEEVTKKVDTYVNMLLGSAEKCEDHGVILPVLSITCLLY